MLFRRKLLIPALALAWGASLSSGAEAALVSQGLTFTFNQVDSNTLSLEIAGTPSGDWTGVQYLSAFDIKDLGLDFSSATATANGPGATNLQGTQSQLSASNLACAKDVGQTGSICFDINPDVLIGPSPIDLTYTIDFSSDLSIASGGPHLQVAFANTLNGPKVGSLLSQTVPLGSGRDVPPPPPPPPPPPGLPEPGTLALLGIALAGIGCARRSGRSTR